MGLAGVCCPEANLVQLPSEGTLVLAYCGVGLVLAPEEGSILSFLIMKQKDDSRRELAANRDLSSSPLIYTTSWAAL